LLPFEKCLQAASLCCLERRKSGDWNRSFAACDRKPVAPGAPHTAEERHHRLGLAQRQACLKDKSACQRAAAA
jgi:hypothetical protein